MSTKFVVTRTSRWSEDSRAPCERATTEMRPYLDRRTVSSPDQLKYPHNAAEDWYARGSNHRLIDGCIARDLEPRQVWVVELTTLEDLLKFCKTYGPLVLEIAPEDEASIEIYDDYRE